MVREKGHEILLRDPHKMTDAVGSKRTGVDPATDGSRRGGATLCNLFNGRHWGG
jgi:hypothetical protein